VTSQARVNDELRSGAGFKQIRQPCRREQGSAVPFCGVRCWCCGRLLYLHV